MNVLIQFPTRWRSDKFLHVLGRYFALLSDKHDVRVQVITDSDDAKMAQADVEDSIRGITHGKYWYRWDGNRNKIEAINRGMSAEIDGWAWDVCILASDDMIPQRKGYDDVICQAMLEHFPDFDGVLWFNDGFVGKKLNTLAICGQKYFRRWDYLYHPKFKSFFSDDDWQKRAEYLGRQVYIDDVIIKHNHPNNVGGALDRLYLRNDATWDEDKWVLGEHEERRFDIPLLDILVCTMPDRARSWARLKKKLEDQLVEFNAKTNVNIIEFADGGQMSIGAKRNVLLGEAKSEYTCFLDDDDNVSSTYVKDILDAIGHCSVDAVGLKGVFFDGKFWRPFVHSVEYHEFVTQHDGLHVRPPNHLNPIRRSIAQAYSFKEINYGEDSDWAMQICNAGALKTQAMVDKPLYYYIPSAVAARTGWHAWNDEVDKEMRRNDRRFGHEKERPPNRVIQVEPGRVIGDPPKIVASAPQHLPSKFPEVTNQADPHRVGIGGWRWEGPEWMKRLKARAAARRP